MRGSHLGKAPNAIKQLDRFRDRHTVAGAKDDRRDALVLGDSLRTDQKAFRELAVDEPVVIQLRELSRMDDSLRESANRLTNQLREQVFRFAPHLLKLCPSANEPWFWALLSAIGAPRKMFTFPGHRVERILKEHRIRRLSKEDVVSVLREPAVHVAPGAAEAAFRHILVLVPQLELIHEQRVQCGKEIEATLEEMATDSSEGKANEHRDAEIILSIPGVGNLIAATVLAEATDPIRRRDLEALRAHAGVAPVTRRSGKKLVVGMRNACNPRLRNALYHWARIAVQRDTLSKAKYACLRGRGHSHGRALKSVADGLLRLLVAMLRNHETFSRVKRDEAAQRHAA